MSAKPIILLEFNELCPSLLDKWMGEGLLPNFQALYDRSAVFTTDADVDEPEYLEPWIQWYSLHTGLPYADHKVFHLTDGPKADHDDIWRLLIDAGEPVMACGSMNTKAFASEGSVYISDPWCDSQDPYPAELSAYQQFVARNVQEYSNKDAGSPVAAAAAFLAFMARHGLRTSTVTDIVKQLISEKMQDKRLHYKRAALLDRLQFDVFRHFWRQKKPTFATFFINSTAHLQHTYWRHMEPDAFTEKPNASDIEVYGGAVLFGYRAMDRLIGDFTKMVGDHARLVFATALSQQPFLKREGRGGQTFYRPRKVEKMLKDWGIQSNSVEPVMTHQYMLRHDDEAKAMATIARLKSFQVGGETLFGIKHDGADVFVGCQLFETVPENAEIVSSDAAISAPFHEVFYHIDSLKSGCHHPHGALWIENAVHHRETEPVSILDVMPTLLALLGKESQIPKGVNGSVLPIKSQTAAEKDEGFALAG
ncbi:MAG: hypothetical protein AAGF15_12125 [Pseudomonadota bacterium]